MYAFRTQQDSIHPKLELIVRRHLHAPYQKPILAHQHVAFKQACVWFDQYQKPLILDSGCGTGLSTVLLARAHPECFVLGLDRSTFRLAKFLEMKKKHAVNNCEVLQVNLEDFWRLLSASPYRIEKHFLLYPNPYPKIGDLQKRWYAHPVFSLMMNLCSHLEVRSNWHLYLEEWAYAANIACGKKAEVQPYHSHHPLTRFEEKYWKAGCPTFRLRYA